MEYCKLQIGCLLVLLYIMIIYYKEKRRFHIRRKFSQYDVFLMIGLVNLVLDGSTAYTVNHLDTINLVFNMILHGLFLISIDLLIFALFLYLLSATEGLPDGKRKRFLLCCPFFINICVVVFFLKDLEYRNGKLSNHSMQNDPNARPAIQGNIIFDQYEVGYVVYPIWLAYHNLIQCTQA